MSAAGLMLAALVLEAALGWPSWLHARIAHPVVWLGRLISLCDRALNRPVWPAWVRSLFGAVTAAAVTALAAWSAWVLTALTPRGAVGFALDALVAASLLAGRSLHDHVQAVLAPLAAGDLPAARASVAKIVGRDTATLDAAGVAGAALESLAENASDGVVAPVFWGALLGLPGLAAYKAINTLDSMIGHRTPRHAAFGGFAARLDDLANLLPARLTGALIAGSSGRVRAVGVMLRDAAKHRSPNAGWPEAAMAGALGVRLSGPRSYGGAPRKEPWLNGDKSDPDVASLRAGLRLYLTAMTILAVILLGVVLLA